MIALFGTSGRGSVVDFGPVPQRTVNSSTELRQVAFHITGALGRAHLIDFGFSYGTAGAGTVTPSVVVPSVTVPYYPPRLVQRYLNATITSFQSPQTADALGGVGLDGRFSSEQSEQQTSLDGTLSITGGAKSIERGRQVTALLCVMLRAAGKSRQDSQKTELVAISSLEVKIKSEAPTLRSFNLDLDLVEYQTFVELEALEVSSSSTFTYDADGVVFEDDEFMSDLELENT